MKHIPGRYLAIAGATVVLVVGIDATAFAATGSSLILGRTNTSTSTTILTTTTSAPPLTLRPSTTDAAPFAVTGNGRVPGLNADRLDSLHASAFQLRISRPCPEGRAMTGVYWSGTPMCVDFRPSSTIHAASARGPFDIPRTFNATALKPGTYALTLTASLQPTVRGTAASPKFAQCSVTINGTVSAVDSAVDVGQNAADLNAMGSVVVDQVAVPQITCGFDRGTWSFVEGRTPTLTVTPLTAQPLTPLTLR